MNRRGGWDRFRMNSGRGHARRSLGNFGSFLHVSQRLDKHAEDLPIAKVHVQYTFQLLEVAVVEDPAIEVLRPDGRAIGLNHGGSNTADA